ncbi:hypothetical protein [Bacillus pumilus]|uniref:Uncharacterized protein n=1 Tax=Bacillus pumilus TaxID=1408 RepID=A0AAD0HMZ5_BACPU|nr:hypothetical protein [Bacillus pumilus]AVM24322.1 hypothetical protein C5695_10930 [Bacillus pumilus]TYS42766.1 hypothetical protein FZC68_10165 [Bacillus pumilus]
MTTQKLTLDHIKDGNKKYDEKVRVQLDEKFHVHIYPNFDPTKITQMIKMALEDAAEIESNKKIKHKLNFVDLLNLYTILTFSDIATIPQGIASKVNLMTELVKSPYYKTINDSFPKESFESIDEKLRSMTEGMIKTQEALTDKANEEILKKVEKLTAEA